MAEAVLDGIKRASGWSIVLAILMIIAGIIAMFAPWEAGLVITLVVGWSAIFNGCAQIVFGFRTHGGWHIALEVILGIIYIIAGIFLLMHPVGGLLALTLFLASFLLVYGVFALVLAFRMRPYRGWGWVLFDGIITILLGILIWAHWPFNSGWVVGTLFGISIFVSGITRLMVSLALRGVAKQAA
ncbi:MAG TPA: HdeD family acid-resistance protein [Bryocella sp.]|nr:HdeD family acid-resistance protein [Bryocella sp.]